MDRRPITDRAVGPANGRLWVRIALVGGLLAGVGSVLSLVLVRPDQIGIATDVYARAGRALLDGEAVYAVHPVDHPGFRFRYPPVIAVLATVYGAIGPTGAFLVQSGVNVLALLTLAWLVDDRLPPLPATDRALAGLTILVAGPVASALVMGQLSPLIALSAVGGCLVALSGRPRRAGLGLGLAAFVKVYPAGAWAWLAAKRSWRALAVAVLVVAGGWLASLAIGVDLTQAYVTTVLLDESSTAAFADGPSLWPGAVTLMRPLAALGVRGTGLWIGALAIVAPPVLACYRHLDDPVGVETALLATVVGLLAVVPLESFYFTLAVPVLVLVAVRIEDHPAIRPLAVGTLLVWLAVPPGPLAALATSLPGALGGLTQWVAESVLRRIQAPLVGSLLVLGACVWANHDLAGENSETETA
ncbi:glycosyltransferase family 87 protein [Halococcoides cellulosivorans]|uniref:DUF2029 domain-containing protein n=1 Tax=Halococcoides cellulosivorans TaxID=1679096 RepID=A0A2R4WZV3_9EURY|nr:glycosyltransferase family 87 protein [Halococcoides cellulosivorans]AWB27068.1 hypothetical protein HARCEL1_04775 [Halococcoides cellulosivorans]